MLVNNPEQIKNYSHLILDEVHERDVDSDLLSLVVKLQMTGYLRGFTGVFCRPVPQARMMVKSRMISSYTGPIILRM